MIVIGVVLANPSTRPHASPTLAFTDVTVVSGTSDAEVSIGVGWADFDNDGDVDLYVARYNAPNRLYRNNGDGTFTDVGASSGTDDAGRGFAVPWGDYDNDGDLDLYLANDGTPNRLYRNDGGVFTDVGAASGTDHTAQSHGAAWADYDHDGDIDLYVSIFFHTANRLYRNNGDGTFTDVGAASGTDDAGNGQGVAWGDYDNDGDADLYVANYGSGNRLYRNDGDGTFTDVAAASGTDDALLGFGVAWVKSHSWCKKSEALV